MNRGFCISIAVVGLLLAGVIGAAANTTFLYRHPSAPGARIVIDYRSGGAVVAPKKRPENAKPSGTAARELLVPRAIAPESTFDFGTMNPLTMGRHDFVIRNEGEAPLKLQVGATTCKCTVSGVAKRELNPGEQTTVSMDWNTGRHPEYSHSATIYTNDPLRKAIRFSVKGKVRVRIAAEPKELPLPPADPDAATTAEVFIHSQVWDDFEICNVQLPLPGFTWRVEEVLPSQVPALEARAIKKLHCEFSSPPESRFSETLHVEIVEADNPARTELLDIPIHGSVKRRLSFYGPAIDARGIIDLGTIDQGDSRQVKLIAKVRDPAPAFGDIQISVFPEFATARIKPHPLGQPGMYELTVEVPAGIAPCQYRSNPSGKLRIDTGHPRIGAVELGLSFAIVPRS